SHRREKERFAILYIDLDRFKSVNDSLDHGGGDRLLQSFSQRILELLPKDMRIARIGSDEFSFILENMSEDSEPVSLAEKVMLAFQDPYQINGKELFVTCSIGIAIYPDNGETSAELMRNADLATF